MTEKLVRTQPLHTARIYLRPLRSPGAYISLRTHMRDSPTVVHTVLYVLLDRRTPKLGHALLDGLDPLGVLGLLATALLALRLERVQVVRQLGHRQFHRLQPAVQPLHALLHPIEPLVDLHTAKREAL